MVRYAFTMIELIFALVIMGIVFLTLPLILINDSSSVEQNLIQEAVFASSAKLGQVLTYPWDENSPDPGTTLTASNVLRTQTATPTVFDRVGTSDFRVGHIIQPLHRRLTPNSAERNASTPLGADGGDLDDLDDFHGTTETLIPTTSTGGYKKNYQITTTVSYLTDTPVFIGANDVNYTFDTGAISANPTNIKMIETVTDQNDSNVWSTIVRLRTFSANIGETDFYKRTY